MIPIQLSILRTFVCLLALNLCLPLVALADGTDNFNDNSKNSSKWGTDTMLSLGVLTEQNQRLEFTCGNPLSNSDTLRPWILERFPVNADWAIQVDTFNNTLPDLSFQVNSAGLVFLHPQTALSKIGIELYSSSIGAPNSPRKGFDAVLKTDDVETGSSDTGELATTEAIAGAIRVEYNGTTKVATCFYDQDISDGYQWTLLASYGLAGVGGTTANADWTLNDSDQFRVYLFGYSDGMLVPSGEIYLDNFVETGGVPPSGEPSPVPVGSFQLRFASDNPLLTRIVCLMGNYQGESPTASQRNYSFDVAQDETGKLVVMGTADGIQDQDGSSVITGPTGAIKTVNGEPTAQIKGSFKGTRDGVSTTFKGSAAGAVEVIDVGGGIDGIGATGSYKSKVGGVPFGEKNLPLLVAAPSGAVDNLQQDWSIQINIEVQEIRGKERPVASAQLTLPNGDTIEFPEKTVKYSAKKGYKLVFKKGTNVTVNPSAIDKKSTVTIKGMTFVQQGDDWEPTGGTIVYKFLGQKGTANLLDLLSP